MSTQGSAGAGCRCTSPSMGAARSRGTMLRSIAEGAYIAVAAVLVFGLAARLGAPAEVEDDGVDRQHEGEEQQQLRRQLHGDQVVERLPKVHPLHAEAARFSSWRRRDSTVGGRLLERYMESAWRQDQREHGDKTSQHLQSLQVGWGGGQCKA